MTAPTRLTPLRWTCLGPGYPPRSCDAEGTTQAGAQQHCDETGHAVITSQRPEGDA